MHTGHMSARNAGIQEALDASSDLGIPSSKIWKHYDASVEPRPTHIAADGQKADKDGNFHVDGLEFPAPGLSGVPSTDIFCHCGAIFQIDEDV